MIRIISATALALALSAAPASADHLRQFDFTATLNLASLEGVLVEGSVIYDATASAVLTGPGFARYPLVDAQISFDGVSVALDPQRSSELSVSNATSGSDAYQIDMWVIGALEGINIQRVAPTFLGASSILTNTALPTTEADFTRFPTRDLFVFHDLGSADQGPLTSLSLTTLAHEAEPLVAACDGFFAPFDVPLSLPRKASRVIPLTLSLFDPDGVELTPTEIAAPVVSVAKTTGVVGELEQLEADAVGRATEGNSFVWDETTGLWTYNLATKPYSAAGTYLVTVLAGNEKYIVSPSCDGVFVRQ